MGKVIIATALFPPEPVVSAFLSYDIANRLYEEGKEVIVLSPRPSRPLNYKFPRISEKFKFRHIILDSYVCPQSKLWGRAKESYSFGKAIQHYIYTHHREIESIYANVWALFGQFLLARAANNHGIPYCIHIHDIYPESYSSKMPRIIGHIVSSFFFPMDKYVLSHASRVIAISSAAAKYLCVSRNLEQKKMFVVRNWQNDEVFESFYKPIPLNSHKLRFMYLGSINPTANIEFLIESFSKLEKSGIVLSILGDGPNRRNCEELARKLKTNVEFGPVMPDIVPSKQAESDVLILSLKEGIARTATPSKLTAYLNSGRPVIACVDTESDCADIIREAKCGIIVAPNDVEGLKNAVRNMSSLSLEDLNRIGKKGLEYARNELSRNKNLGDIIKIILSMTDRRNIQ